jgi:DNA-binding GntR family transcriptional regulator
LIISYTNILLRQEFGTDDVEQGLAERIGPLSGTAGSRRVTAAAAIADEMRADIVAVRLAPGQPLLERALTERFGVSRTPLREALIRLAEEGLVDIRPQSGTFVARIPLGAIPEAVVVRQALEGAAVELAVASGAAGADRLRDIIARQKAFADRNDREAFHEADENFHECVAGLSGFPGLWRTIRQAKMQIDRCRRLTLPVLGRMPQVLAEHRIIADAIEAGDAQSARAAMRAHLGAVLPDARRLAQTHPDYFA